MPQSCMKCVCVCVCGCMCIKERDCQTQLLISSPNLFCPICSTENKWRPHRSKRPSHPPVLYTARDFLSPSWPHGTHRGRRAWFFSKINVQVMVPSCSPGQSPWPRPPAPLAWEAAVASSLLFPFPYSLQSILHGEATVFPFGGKKCFFLW